MSQELAVIGVGLHPFGRFPGKVFYDLGAVACREALTDAQMAWKDIQVVVAGIDMWSGLPGGHAGNSLAQVMGSTGIPVINVLTGCNSGATALGVLCSMVASGACEVGMAVGMSVSPHGFFPAIHPLVPNPFDLDTVRFSMTGFPNPGYWALDCVRRMHEHGTTERHLAKIRAKNSRHGALNPYARFRVEMTEDQVLSSPMVCYPFTLYELCAVSDGAAAAIVCSREFAKKYTNHPIELAAWSLSTRNWDDASLGGPFLSTPARPGAEALSEVKTAAANAFKQAGLGPEDVDFLELPDTAEYFELPYLEKIGICGEGEADHLIAEGATEIGGRIPVCTSGGFASFGEATPAMGILQIHELVQQLRGQAGARQVEGARVGYSQAVGIYQNCGAFILKR